MTYKSATDLVNECKARIQQVSAQESVQLQTSDPATLFIANPNLYSFLVALFAGMAGILSLTTAKSGALVGVLISVTTIPAAANVGVAAAYGNWDDCLGAFGQLSLNLGALATAGIATAGGQRLLYARRRERHVQSLTIRP